MLEGRHVIGLFMLMLLFSGLFFTLGFLMGRNQYDGQVRAASSLREIADATVQPKAEVVAKSGERKTSPAENNSQTSANPGWEIYRAVDSSKTDDTLKPVANPSVSSARAANIVKPQPASSRSSSRSSAVASAGVNLQVAALTRKADALALANTLRRKNFPTFVQTPHGDKYYHVLVGPYANEKAVETARKGLEASGFKAIVKR